jgi:hypothetical protein
MATSLFLKVTIARVADPSQSGLSPPGGRKIPLRPQESRLRQVLRGVIDWRDHRQTREKPWENWTGKWSW